MMDYFELGDSGCCLICEDRYEGCLCYECKCKKCIWHSENHEEGSEYYDYENDKHVCVFNEINMGQYEEGKTKSYFKIDTVIITTEKAVECSIKNTN